MMPSVPKRLQSTGKVVLVNTCDVCGARASFIDTRGKVARAYCGMREGRFCCVASEGETA